MNNKITKKIGIITYYNVHNHGALLQANALASTLENITKSDVVDISFLQIERDYRFSEKTKSKYVLSVRSIPFFIEYAKKVGLKNIIFNFKKHRLLNRFKKANIKLGESVYDFEGDCAVIGSDEVFSTEIGFNPFMYSIGLEYPTITYAASFGPTTLEDIKSKQLDELISKGLLEIQNVSVRDLNSYSIVKSLCPRLEPTLVCDPVLLYGYNKELKELKFKSKDKFVLIYSYDKNMNEPTEVEKIRDFAKTNNLKINSVGFFHKWADKNINVDPIHLLNWIKNASFVITDTFHGSVISILTNTNFCAIIRGNSNKLSFLLEQHKLQNRIIDDLDNLGNLYNSKIDFEEVDKIVEINRNKSYEYLKKALE